MAARQPETGPTRRGRPRSGGAAQIEARLLDAAWRVLAATGPEHFAIDKVAREARASKKTIYARHANRRALLEAVLAQRIDLFLAALAGPGPVTGEPPEAAFAALARRHLLALVEGQGRLIERLADWLDATAPGGPGRDVRAGAYARVQAFLERQLPETARRAGLAITGPPDIVRYWLDGIVGHSRTMIDFPPNEVARWADGYSRLFLKATAS